MRDPALRRELEGVVDPRAPDAIDATGPRARHHLALRREGRTGDTPPVVHLPDALRVGDPRVVEEHLVEVDVTRDVAERPDLDARLVQIDEEVGDALALGYVGVGAREEDRPVGEVGPRRPHLLTGHGPVVAIASRARGQGRQIAPGPGLAEQLAPALLVADDRWEEAEALRVGAVGEECRRAQVETQRVQTPEVVRRQLGLDRAGGIASDTETAVLDGPRRNDHPGTSEDRVPRLVLVSRTNPHGSR